MKQLQNKLSVYGMGTTCFWDGYRDDAFRTLEKAVREYGINVIDTAEMYGNGTCEQQTGKLLKRVNREDVYLIDKILPSNCNEHSFRKSLDRSLELLGTDHIDLFLLHWRGDADLAECAYLMEDAKKTGKIRSWGVSNFDTSDMEDLFAVPYGDRCACNQILYNLVTRGPEYDLLPWLKEHGVMACAYSSLGMFASERNRVRQDPVIQKITAETGFSAEAVMLAFAARNDDVLSLFQTSSEKHLDDDLRCLEFDIRQYMDAIDAAFPAPDHKVPLAKL